MTNTVAGTYLVSIQHVLNVGFYGISLTFSGHWDGSPASAVLAFSHCPWILSQAANEFKALGTTFKHRSISLHICTSHSSMVMLGSKLGVH